MRLDVFLANCFKDVSRAYLQDIIASGNVKINDKIIKKKGCILNQGDHVRLLEFMHPSDRVLTANAEVKISYVEDNAFYGIVNKSAGVPSQANTYKDQNALVNGLLHDHPCIACIGDDGLRPGIVHRLDADTSGVMAFAKTQEAYQYFRSLFDRRAIKKTYLALVLGQVEDADELDWPIAHHHRNIKKMVALTDPHIKYRSSSREAYSRYECVERFDAGYSLLRVWTKSGRMHQVRVHMAAAGYPLVGDRLYQDDRQRQKDQLGAGRHCLHAETLAFFDPWRQKDQTFQTELPEDMKRLVQGLQSS